MARSAAGERQVSLPPVVIAGRSRRSFNAKRWLLVAGALTAIVLLVDLSIANRSRAPERTLASQAWLDSVLPVIGASNSQGIQLNELRLNGPGLTASDLSSQYGQVVQQAKQSLSTVQGLKPTPEVQRASGLLISCLSIRSEAAQQMDQAVTSYLSSSGQSDPGTSVRTIVKAAGTFNTGNDTYAKFVRALPKLGVAMPPSVWQNLPNAYDPGALTSFLTTVRGSSTLASAPGLSVLAVTTDPAAESAAGKAQILTPAPNLSVTVTVGNVGNVAEKTNVTAALSSSTSGSGSASQPISVAPGQDTTVTLGPLHPPTGPNVTLTVSVPAVSGETTTKNNSQTLVLQMPPASIAGNPPSKGS